MADRLFDKQISFGRASIDKSKWIVEEHNVWPVPVIKYFPTKNKIKEDILTYNKEIKAESII